MRNKTSRKSAKKVNVAVVGLGFMGVTHIKDARRTKVPGTWGEEVAVGTGEVDWPAFFATLRKLNYTGDFVIEREAGSQRVADIRTAKEIVAKTGEGVA